MDTHNAIALLRSVMVVLFDWDRTHRANVCDSDSRENDDDKEDDETRRLYQFVGPRRVSQYELTKRRHANVAYRVVRGIVTHIVSSIPFVDHLQVLFLSVSVFDQFDTKNVLKCFKISIDANILVIYTWA